MKSTHTPGPWNTEKPYGEPGLYIAAPDTSLVAKVWDENEANARLIAAAPALLDFAKQYLETWPAAGDEDSLTTEARRVIAKATE
jgi:hypothetical protein